MKSIALLASIISFILGGLMLVFVRGGFIFFIMITLTTVSMLVAVSLGNRLYKEGGKREETTVMVIAEIGILMAILSNFFAMLRR